MSVVLSIDLTSRGVSEVHANPRSIAEANEAAHLFAASSLPIRLLHSSLAENARAGEFEEFDITPLIWVPRSVGDDQFFEPLRLEVPAQPDWLWSRGPFPEFFSETIRMSFPDLAPDHTGEELLVMLDHSQSPEWQWLGCEDSGWVEDDRGLIYVAELTSLSANQLRCIDSFCHKGGLNYDIVGGSHFWPSHKFRVEIFQPVAA